MGVISIQFQGESLEIKHESWLNTDLDFIHCLFLNKKLYFTEYGDLYQVSFNNPVSKVGKSSSSNPTNKIVKLAEYTSKIVCLLELTEGSKYVFLENGYFYEIEEKLTESSETPLYTQNDRQDSNRYETGFDHVYSVSSSLNGVLAVVSGKLKSFSPRIITKIIIHHKFILNSSASDATFHFICNCLSKYKNKLGDYSDIIYAIKYQNLMSFIRKYIEKLLYKDKNKNINS